MKDSTKYANDLAKKDNEDATEAVRKSGKTQVLALTPAEKAVWKKALVPVHREMEGRIGKDLIQQVYKETGFTP
jgi:C4-dicarboxylate-binding protein DctP